ncbi:hypothetical protein FRACYDRAFT_269552 [Fragilariopsis cylindrus CCMP1102]|uniref:Uncharacterized protein n=1 Tax=Fragilariopsis cylindrus CCMP1102 TaxID=635003 RepID=A0A1E7F7Q7_9STRA|nr:hypothetical protein FRACYDRAFT_269552 [Fragilariopsis cylindrus CCMP1102]|eukprot:OEU14232.1 hypothetical protein FRACYDRAFT_269552 [Fragilariopsis cylindrus CCMP1102]
MNFYPSSLLIFITLALWLSCSCVVDASISRQECKDQGGVVVGDIGDGAIFQPDYLCAINDEAPSNTVLAQDIEPIFSKVEVCCGGTVVTTISRQECKDKGGVVVGDIGDGAIHRSGYLCPTNGEAPSDRVFELDGGPIAIEGEVCCGGADGDPTSGGPLFNQQNAISALQAALASLIIFL